MHIFNVTVKQVLFETMISLMNVGSKPWDMTLANMIIT